MRMQHLITTTLILVITCCGNAQDLSRYPIVPWPQSLQAQDGQFELTTETRVTLSDPASPELRAIADFWAERGGLDGFFLARIRTPD